MPTDDERREVARRLRELESCSFDDGEYIDRGEIDGVLDLWCDDGAWYEAEGVMRLADLIEPSCDRDTPQKVAEEMFGKMRHSTKEEADAYDAMLKSKSIEVHPVDREALLALADEMSMDGMDGSLMPMSEYARRIREAVGE